MSHTSKTSSQKAAETRARNKAISEEAERAVLDKPLGEHHN